MSDSIMDQVAAAKSAVPSVTADEAAELQRSGALIVDVRDHPELAAQGKVPGAKHVTRGMLEFLADPASPYHDLEFTKDRTLVLYCASGGRSALAGQALQNLGFTDVRNLGGFKDWVEAGGDVEQV